MHASNVLPQTKPTPEEARAAMLIALAVAETIRELGEVPSGHLYAQLCGKIDLRSYEAIIGTLTSAKLVEQTPAHLLRWVGPLKGVRK